MNITIKTVSIGDDNGTFYIRHKVAGNCFSFEFDENDAATAQKFWIGTLNK